MSTVYPVGGTCKIVVAATEASATESANVQVDRFLALPAVFTSAQEELGNQRFTIKGARVVLQRHSLGLSTGNRSRSVALQPISR